MTCESIFQTLPQTSHLAGLQDLDLLVINGVSVLYQKTFTLVLHLQKKKISPSTQIETEQRVLQLFATLNNS